MKILILSIFFFYLFLPAQVQAEQAVDIEPVQIGELEIWPVPDADVWMEKNILPDLKKYPQYEGAFSRGPLPAITQFFFTKSGKRNILFDTGWGKNGKIKGKSPDILQKNGISPESITDIILTHMDMDHIGGLVENDKKVFPNANIWISKPEFQSWSKGNIKSRSDSSIELAKNVIKLYKDNIRLFDYGTEIMPGIKALDASGHTPGHTAYEISSANDKLLIGGDFIHVWQIQLPLPQSSSVYDNDKEKAAETRTHLLDMAANEKILLTGMHLPLISPVMKRPNCGFNMREPR